MGWGDNDWGGGGYGRSLPVAPGLAGSPPSLREFDATDIAGAYAAEPEAFAPQPPSMMDRIMLAIGKAQETHGYLFRNPGFVEMGKRTQDDTLKKLEAHQAVREFTALSTAREKHVREEKELAQKQRDAATMARAVDNARQFMPGMVPKVDPSVGGPPAGAAPGAKPSYESVVQAFAEAERGNMEPMAQLNSLVDFDPERVKAIAETESLKRSKAAEREMALDPEIAKLRERQAYINSRAAAKGQLDAQEAAGRTARNQKPDETPVRWVKRIADMDTPKTPDPNNPFQMIVNPEDYRENLRSAASEAIRNIPSKKWSEGDVADLFHFVDTPELYGQMFAALDKKYPGELPAGLAARLKEAHARYGGGVAP